MSNNIKSPRAADLARDKFFDEFYSSIVSYAVYNNISSRISSGSNNREIRDASSTRVRGRVPTPPAAATHLGDTSTGRGSGSGAGVKKGGKGLSSRPSSGAYADYSFPSNLIKSAESVLDDKSAQSLESKIYNILYYANKNDKSSIEGALAKAKDLNAAVLYTLWTTYCRNCYLGGQGLVKHTIPECIKAKNPCHLECQICFKKSGKKVCHWSHECPNHTKR